MLSFKTHYNSGYYQKARMQHAKKAVGAIGGKRYLAVSPHQWAVFNDRGARVGEVNDTPSGATAKLHADLDQTQSVRGAKQWTGRRLNKEK